MALASQPNSSASVIHRLDLPENFDLDAMEANAAKPQRGAWRFLINIFESAHTRHCGQFSLEPDTTLWRLRYQTVEGFEEHIISDPSLIIWALDALQIALWGDDYHKISNRTARFTWAKDHTDHLITLRAVKTVKGDLLQFDIEPVLLMPPTLDAIGLDAKQLRDLRQRLNQRQGMLLITSSDNQFLNDTLLAVNQELVSPDRKLLSISERHRYTLPRTAQIDLGAQTPSELEDTWISALASFHDVLLSATNVPEQFQQEIADRCDQGTLAIQTMRVTNAADAISLLNANILRRAPLHRAVTTVLCHFPVASICSACAVPDKLSDDEQQWLEQLRTPASENVISWLVDGNADQFMTGAGCDVCDGTGCGKPQAVFNLQHRDEKTNQFPSPPHNLVRKSSSSLQRQLMSLAKAGNIRLSEVIRVLQSA